MAAPMGLCGLYLLLLVLVPADPCTATANPQVLFFSDTDSLFRAPVDPSFDDTVLGQAKPGSPLSPSISPRGLAATCAALLGVPSPPGTNGAVAKEVSALVAPNPFVHTPLMVVLALRGTPPLPGEWLAGVQFGSQHLQLAQRRELWSAEGSPLLLLRQELSSVRQSSEGGIRVLPEPDWERTPINKAADEEAWDAALLDGNILGSKGGYSMSSIISTFGPKGESFVHDVIQVARLVESSAAGPGRSQTSALVAASISLAGLKSNNEADVVQAAEAALAVVVDSVFRSKKIEGPVAVALILDEHKPGGGLDIGLLLPTGPNSGWNDKGRSLLGDAEADTPYAVEVKALYISVWLILLTALIIGMWLMCAMNVTKDTLLYSGAKID